MLVIEKNQKRRKKGSFWKSFSLRQYHWFLISCVCGFPPFSLDIESSLWWALSVGHGFFLMLSTSGRVLSIWKCRCFVRGQFLVSLFQNCLAFHLTFLLFSPYDTVIWILDQSSNILSYFPLLFSFFFFFYEKFPYHHFLAVLLNALQLSYFLIIKNCLLFSDTSFLVKFCFYFINIIVYFSKACALKH